MIRWKVCLNVLGHWIGATGEGLRSPVFLEDTGDPERLCTKMQGGHFPPQSRGTWWTVPDRIVVSDHILCALKTLRQSLSHEESSRFDSAETIGLRLASNLKLATSSVEETVFDRRRLFRNPVVSGRSRLLRAGFDQPVIVLEFGRSA